MIRYNDQILGMATTSIAKNVLLYVSINNLEQSHIAKKLNRDPSDVSKMMRGDKKCSKAFIKEFCDEYQIPIETMTLSPEKFLQYLNGDISYDEVIDMRIKQYQKKKTTIEPTKEECTEKKVKQIYISKKYIDKENFTTIPSYILMLITVLCFVIYFISIIFSFYEYLFCIPICFVAGFIMYYKMSKKGRIYQVSDDVAYQYLLPESTEFKYKLVRIIFMGVFIFDLMFLIYMNAVVFPKIDVSVIRVITIECSLITVLLSFSSLVLNPKEISSVLNETTLDVLKQKYFLLFAHLFMLIIIGPFALCGILEAILVIVYLCPIILNIIGYIITLKFFKKYEFYCVNGENKRKIEDLRLKTLKSI